MTIQLPARSTFASSQPAESDCPRTAVIAIDLSALGVEVFDFDSTIGEDFPVESLNFARLAGMARAATDAGLDAVCLGPTFRVRSDLHVRDGRLDPLTAALRLANPAGGVGAGRYQVAVPADPYHVGEAVARMLDIMTTTNGLEPTAASFAIELWIGQNTDLAAIAEQVREARAAGIGISAVVTGTTALALDPVLLAETADVIRLRETDPHRGREVRYALRSAARRAGGDVKVLIDLFYVISASTADADVRASLISEIGADRHAQGAARALGTVHDVADAIEAWVAQGAADGFVLIPGSLPTDLSSLVMGVLPLLKARGVAQEAAAEA